MTYPDIRRTLLAGAGILAMSVTGQGLAAQEDGNAQGDVVIVVDGSNSMWGQIDGTSKIEMAKSAFGEILPALPADRRVGLVAYGHRQAASCGDIEIISRPAAGNRDALAKAVQGLTPRGKTPITDALRQAADLLPEGGAGSIILLSDGVETCGGNACAFAAELKARNVDLTAHVIGLDIESPADRASLSCIADQTGGIYMDAASTGELADALEKTAEAAPQPVATAKTFTLQALDGMEGPVIDGARFEIINAASEAVIASGVEGEYDFLPGDYRIVASHDGRSGALDRRVLESDEGDVITVVIDAALPGASLSFTSPVEASSVLSVDWSGPDATGDYIELLGPDGERLEETYFVYTADGAPSLLRVPGEAGDYALRYVFANRNAVLATEPLVVTPAKAVLDAPAQAEAGTLVAVAWTGPAGEGDRIGVFRPGDERYAYEPLVSVPVANGNPAELRLPGEAGGYELRYVTGNDQSVLGIAAITATAVEGALRAPDSIEAGYPVSIGWEGTFDGETDWVTIVPADAGDLSYANSVYLNIDGMVLRAPAEAGAYEVRVLREAGDTNTVLERRTLTVSASAATLTAPERVTAGAAFTVEAQGPVRSEEEGDVYVAITPPEDGAGSYSGGYEYVYQAGPVELGAPDEPGTYELRYVIYTNSPSILTRRTLIVE